MEENERLRQLVGNSDPTPLPEGYVIRQQKDQELPFPENFTWELPEPQVLEEVQLDGLTIRDLFEQYGIQPIVTGEMTLS